MFTYFRGDIKALNCVEPAIFEFPEDGLTREEREEGYVLIHLLLAIYIFLMLAIVCDDYFVPAVERLCTALDMSTDVAGATFMAAATSAPELFVNIIGTFITQGDLGIGTIVGSAVFNTLGVAAVCGVFSGVKIELDWWPLTRDCTAYSLTVTALVVILYDSVVQYYEALVLIGMYALYLLIMYYDKSLNRWVKNSSMCLKMPCFDMPIDNDAKRDSRQSKPEEELEPFHICQFPTNESCMVKFYWLIKYPAHLIFFITVPDCRHPRLRNYYPVTFIMCCVWIGILSYLVAWMLTAVGDTFHIPDSVMGITFLAVGTSIPEAVSSIIVARHGYGSMAICNSLGSNTFDILVCLGFPWLIKTTLIPAIPGIHSLNINSSGLVYTTVTLLTTVFMLYCSFVGTKFTLGITVGVACLILYLVVMVVATLVELNVFFPVNLPTCGH